MSAGVRWSDRRVLVTGGLGFIGSALTLELVARGADVTVVDALIPEHGGNPSNLDGVRDRVQVELSDLRDQRALDALVQEQEYVFHLAGQVSHGDSMRDPHLDLEVNCVATMNLLEACRRRNPEARLLFTSTRQVYGVPQSLPLDESHPTIPVDVNGINKLAAEYYHLLYHRVYGLRSSVLRLTNTYGPRQQIRNDRQGFIGIFLRKALRGERIDVYGTGHQVRDFNYVDDVVSALLLAAGTEDCFGRIFNLGAPRGYSLLEFVKLLAQLTGVEHRLVPFPDDRRLIDIGDYRGDYSAFAGATGWEPAVDLQEGLERTLESYRTRREIYWG